MNHPSGDVHHREFVHSNPYLDHPGVYFAVSFTALRKYRINLQRENSI